MDFLRLRLWHRRTLPDRQSGLPVVPDREISFPTEFVHKVNEKAEEMDKNGGSRHLSLGREKGCLQLVRERPYDLGELGKEYVLPFNSYLGICRIVVIEIITPFAYTNIERDIDASSSRHHQLEGHRFRYF